MTHEGRLLTAEGLSLSGKIGKMRAVVFRDQLQASPAQKFRSLFPGIKFGASYKLCQRTAAYGTQPFVFDYVHKHYNDEFARVAGSKRAKNLAFATAAAITGTMEIVFLPLDTLKIIAQTNPASLQGRTFLQIVQQEKFRLYRAAGWTALRNFPGSFCLFGGSALVKEKVFHLENYKDASLFQELVASTTGAIWSLTISSPADVIKARVQRGSLSLAPGQVQVNGRDILRELLKREGPWGLFKGLNTKFVVVAPKLVLSFTVYNQMMSYFSRLLDPQETVPCAGSRPTPVTTH